MKTSTSKFPKATTWALLCIFALLPFILISCSADDDAGDVVLADHYFRFEVDGNQVEYLSTPQAQVNLTGSVGYDGGTQVHSVNVAGIKNILAHSANTLTIFIGSKEEILTGVTYANIAGAGVTVPDFIFQMSYYDQEGDLFIAALNTVPLWENASVRFEVINEREIKGTFSGTLLRYESSSGQNVLLGEVEVRNGEFKVPRY